MDFSIPQPPVTYAVHIFHTFVRVYLTVHQPIDFIHNLTPEQISQAFIDHSHRARQILLQLYGLFQPLVVNYPFQQQALEAAYYDPDSMDPDDGRLQRTSSSTPRATK